MQPLLKHSPFQFSCPRFHPVAVSPVASSTGGGLGSIAGGAELKLTGSGFNGDTEVLIGSRPCEITKVTDSSALTCVSKPMKQVCPLECDESPTMTWNACLQMEESSSGMSGQWVVGKNPLTTLGGPNSTINLPVVQRLSDFQIDLKVEGQPGWVGQ